MMEASSTTSDFSDIIQINGNNATSAADHKDAIINCCICRKAVTSKKAKLLPCLHTLCSPCEIISMTEGKLTCLFCNQNCEAEEIVEHFLVQYIDLGLEEAKCENCAEKLIAKYKCVECGDNLCLECGRAHKRVKVTKDHRLKEIDAGSSNEAKCAKHPNEDLSWFCLTCNKVTCRNCQLESHSGHQYRSFEEQAPSYRNEMTKIMEDNRKKLTNLAQIVTVSSQRVKEVDAREMSLRSELSKAVQHIQQILTERGKFLLKKIETASYAKRQTYNDVKMAAENIEAMTKQVNFFIEAAFASNDQHTVLRSLEMVNTALNKIEKLKQERRSAVNILQMEVQLTLNLPFADVAERLKNMGELIVDRIPPVLPQSIPTTTQPTVAIMSPSTSHHVSMMRMMQPISSAQQMCQPQSPTVGYHRALPNTLQAGSPVSTSSGPIAVPGGMQYHQQNNFAPNQNSFNQRYLMSPAQRGATFSQFNQVQQPVNMRIDRPFPITSQSYQSSSRQSSRMQSPSFNHLQSCIRTDSNQNQSQIMYPTAMPQPAYQNVCLNDPRMLAPQVSGGVPMGPQQYFVTPPNFSSQSSSCRQANLVNIGPPRLQYGPAVQNSARVITGQKPRTIPQQNSPVKLQSNVSPSVRLQKANSPVLVANLMNSSSHQVKTSGQQNVPTLTTNSNSINKRKASGDRIDDGFISTFNNRAPAPLIQLSPSPENRDEIKNSEIKSSSANGSAQSLMITNVVSIKNQMHKEEISKPKSPKFIPSSNHVSSTSNSVKDPPVPSVSVEVSPVLPAVLLKGSPVPSVLVNDSPALTVSVKDSTQALSVSVKHSPVSEPSTSQNSYQKPVSIMKTSRLARKSIARLSENTFTNPNVNATKETESGAVIPSADNGNEISKSPNSETMSLTHLDDFPMTQAFIPMVDEDDAVETNTNCNEKNDPHPSCPIQQNDDRCAIVNGNHANKRETPDAGEVTTTTDDNRWEDYCSVCQNGGDLMCCEAKSCTKVFHIYDHVPQYNELPKDQWFCTLCINPNDFKSKEDDIPSDQRVPPHLTAYEQKSCERILLTLYCHTDSEPFHNPVDESFVEYYRTIKHPVDFSMIRSRLNPLNTSKKRYLSVETFLNNMNRVFINCAVFNDSASVIGKAGKIVGAKYLELVNEYFPNMVDLAQICKGKKRSHIGSDKKRKRLRLELASDSEDSNSSRFSSPFVKT